VNGGSQGDMVASFAVWNEKRKSIGIRQQGRWMTSTTFAIKQEQIEVATHCDEKSGMLHGMQFGLFPLLPPHRCARMIDDPRSKELARLVINAKIGLAVGDAPFGFWSQGAK
jgi:hypothetical protein